MYWRISFRQPYDATDTPTRCVLITSKSNDIKHIREMFGDYYPNAEIISLVSCKGIVEAVISDFDVLLKWEAK